MDNALDEHFNLLMNNDIPDMTSDGNLEPKNPLLNDLKDKSTFSLKNMVYWICVVCLVIIICVIIYYIMIKLFLITPSEKTNDKKKGGIEKKEKEIYTRSKGAHQ